MIRVAPSGEAWELIRSFTGSGRNLIAVIRAKSNGHIRNVAMTTFESWPEATA
ncbi:hypothetical protein [Microbacterium testaceum]|uniref:hypothetical protein n=1 Tax=Microbacterium testaceum TaxID=2033 RepID=UPI0022E2935D|nr:hypothetical protein [Microbacterium testaceum]